MGKIRLVIADDQSIIRDGLKMILEMEEDIEVIGVACNGEEAYQLAMSLKPDVILMDIRMPIVDGVSATKRICEVDKEIKIIILTTFSDDVYIFEALVAGAKGYLLKDVESEELANVIRTVMKGGVLIHPKVAEKMVKSFSPTSMVSPPPPPKVVNIPLTQRERDVVKLIALGKSNKEIAGALYLSEGTVKNHITNILSKLELRDRTQLAVYAKDMDV